MNNNSDISDNNISDNNISDNDIFNDNFLDNNLVDEELMQNILTTALDIKDNYDEMIKTEQFSNFIKDSKNQIEKFKLNLNNNYDKYSEIEINSLYVSFTLHLILSR